MTPTKKHFRKRDAILTCLRSTTSHPSADWIYQELKPQIPDLSLGTVYRNLTLFKEQGLIHSLGTVGGIERFDGNMEPHVHFVCTCCSSVQDLELAQKQMPDSILSQVAHLGEVENTQLTFFGRCKECLKEKVV